MSEDVARDAYNLALETKVSLQGHEKTCAERYKNIAEKHDEIKDAIEKTHERIDKYANITEKRIGKLDAAKWAAMISLLTLLFSASGWMFIQLFYNGAQ